MAGMVGTRHWVEAYIGQPYVKDVQDCAYWAERILREHFGRTIKLPTNRAQGLRPRSRQIAEQKDRFTRPTATPAEGDAVLMLMRGDLYHIGVYVKVNGEPQVLHADEGFGAVVLTRIRDLAAQSMRLEGYYQWI